VPLLLAGALLLAAQSGCGGDGSEARSRGGWDDKPKAVVTTRAVEVSVDDLFLEREATLVAINTAQISTRQEGFVSQVAPEVGDIVHEGDFLAQIDETDTRLALAEFGAEVRRAKADVAEAKRSMARAQQLFESHVLSQGELDDQKTRLERARADLAEQEARRARIEIELYGLKVLAPMPGVVTRLYTEQGEYLKRGDKMLELKRIDSLVALCTVSERYLADVREGSSVYVHITAFPDQVYPGLVWKIVPDALLESRAFPVKILLANPDLRLKPGMSARVSFVRRVEKGLLLPKDAVLEEDDQHYVFVVRADTAERRDVELGSAFGDKWHVRSGIGTEDAVIVTGNEDLLAGAAVTVVDLPPPGPPTLPTAEAPDIATGSE
jgi:RND family efflux transporter MFP subunit